MDRRKEFHNSFSIMEWDKKPIIFVAFRLLVILATYYTPWLFMSSPRTALFNLFIFLPEHLLVDEIVNRFLQKKRREIGDILMQKDQHIDESQTNK